MEVQRGVTTLASAARQPGEEINETYGMSTSEGRVVRITNCANSKAPKRGDLRRIARRSIESRITYNVNLTPTVQWELKMLFLFCIELQRWVLTQP